MAKRHAEIMRKVGVQLFLGGCLLMLVGLIIIIGGMCVAIVIAR